MTGTDGVELFRAKTGILSFWLPRAAKRELCRGGVLWGDRGSNPSGSPEVACANRWKSDASPKGSVGDSQVCGRGLSDTFSRSVGEEMGLESGNVRRARGGEASKVSMETVRDCGWA